MGMTKKLSAVGNSLGLIIERPILDLLNIDANTELDISTDGHKLIIEPLQQARKNKIKGLHEKVMKKNDKTFQKLAKLK
jgi:antitoxin component of MazEF toxin-antitoxin module